MKRITILVILLLSFLGVQAQHMLPIDVVVNPQDADVTIFGSFSGDANADDFGKTFSSTGKVGFVVNGKYIRGGGKNGLKETWMQFIVNFDPIIVDWNPFTWNTLMKHDVDSFNVQKLPFNEDALLHIGWRRYSMNQLYRGGQYQKSLNFFFADLFWRPYIFTTQDEAKEHRFQTFNFNAGWQYSYVNKELPVLGTFLIGFAPQINFLFVNESEDYQKSFESLFVPADYPGKMLVGPGGKLTVQIKNLNIYIEGRQYYAMDSEYSGRKFSHEPVILVGAFVNGRFFTRKRDTNNGNNNNNYND